MAGIHIKLWRDVRKQVVSLNPQFGGLLDEVDGVENFKVLQVQYHFGQHIIQDGRFKLPFQGEMCDYQDAVIPQQVREMFDYTWQVMPLSMVVCNTIEAFITLATHINPMKLYHPGQLFASLDMFDINNESSIMADIFSIVAGCRSLITLPQIAHAQYQERVTKRLRLPQRFNPKHFSEQWQFFKSVAQARQAQHGWCCEMLFFSKEFVDAIKNSPEIKLRLLIDTWRNMPFTRHQYNDDLLWDVFAERNLSLSMRNHSLVIESVRYLLRVMVNASPAYAPATLETVGPLDSLTKVLLNIYRIRYYLPVFMQLQHYDMHQPLYYSLQNPGIMSTTAIRHHSTKQAINDLKKIKYILSLFKEQVLSQDLPIPVENTLLYKRLQSTTFEYFHPKADEDILTDIDNELFAKDLRFSVMRDRYNICYKKLNLPNTSQFFHGCIRITPTVTSAAVADKEKEEIGF